MMWGRLLLRSGVSFRRLDGWVCVLWLRVSGTNARNSNEWYPQCASTPRSCTVPDGGEEASEAMKVGCGYYIRGYAVATRRCPTLTSELVRRLIL